MNSSAPLSGVRVLEIESIGPGPFAAMFLSDLGANVLRISRPAGGGLPNPVLGRGRSGRLILDLKADKGRTRLGQLVPKADVLLEGYRPGVMEKLGFGPDDCLRMNPRLVYGRITGWGAGGPLSPTAGHDINYIALTGALHAIGTNRTGPLPPLNLVGDFGGGGMLLVAGVLAALVEAGRTGNGRVVDAAMVDGAALLMAMIYGMRATGMWPAPRAGNLFDGTAYFYRCYQCADDKWIAVGAIEAPFRRQLFAGLGIAGEGEHLMDLEPGDPEVHRRLEEIISKRARDEWAEVFAGTDACVTPVLSLDEAARHPHNLARQTFAKVDGFPHPNPAPRFSPARAAGPVEDLLGCWGLTKRDLAD